MLTTRKIIALLVLGSMSIFAAGCEETVDITDAAYVERLVVSGVISPSAENVGIRLTRTLPINVAYDAAAAAVKGADVRIAVRDGAGAQLGTFVLADSGNGDYRATAHVPVREGYRYDLSVHWNGRSAEASTRVPQSVPIDTAFFIDTVNDWGQQRFLRTIFHPMSGQVYLVAAGVFMERSPYVPFVFPNYGYERIFRLRDTTDGGMIISTVTHTPFNKETPVDAASVLLIYDLPYYEFYTTYNNHNDGGEIFTTGSDNVHWNVTGDAIGLFIGMVEVWRRV